MDKKARSEYSIFYPRTKSGLLDDYSELKDYRELKGLNQSSALFVWYYACEASPLADMEDGDEKRREAIMLSFGRDGYVKMSKDNVKKWEAAAYPDKITAAVEVMKTFRMGPRIRAMKMVEKIMDNFEELIDVDIKEFKDKDGNVDWSKKKAYIDSASKVAEKLPSLIDQSEGRFGVGKGVNQEQDEIDDGGKSALDIYHSKKEN